MYDKAAIYVRAGSGGDGSVSFRKEKFVPYGGPDGGDGGKGGDVVIRADKSIDDLRMYRRKRLYNSENGENGSGRRKHGRNGKDLVLEVPEGTIVYGNGPEGDILLLADLKSHGEEYIAAKGGSGGQANVHFASSINQAPHIAQRDEAGEEAELNLEMRLIADVGVIGYPNAGKSTLLRKASAAQPKIGEYPFTTLEPVLGVVETGNERFVIAEIPGLIEGAHAGKGLGHEFLRHAMRTRMFVHLISGDSDAPVEDMVKVNEELYKFERVLAERPQIVAVNKIDIPGVAEKRKEIEREFRSAGVTPVFISAEKGEGIPELMNKALEILRTKQETPVVESGEVKVFRPQPRENRYRVWREENEDRIEYHVDSPELARLYLAPGSGSGELRGQMAFQLKKMGAYKELEKLGIEKGDTVKCGDYSWYW